MIARVRGRIIEKSPERVVIEAAGVGYEIEIPHSVFGELGEVGGEAVLLTHMVVREDALTLYGFGRPAERRMFGLLLGVAGVGPRLALNFLSALRVEEIQRAILAEDADLLTVVSGVGKKTARRVIVDLKTRLEEEGVAVVPGTRRGGGPADVPGLAVEALGSLGFTRREAWAAVSRVLEEEGVDLGVEEIVRRSLKTLGPVAAKGGPES